MGPMSAEWTHDGISKAAAGIGGIVAVARMRQPEAALPHAALRPELANCRVQPFGAGEVPVPVLVPGIILILIRDLDLMLRMPRGFASPGAAWLSGRLARTQDENRQQQKYDEMHLLLPATRS